MFFYAPLLSSAHLLHTWARTAVSSAKMQECYEQSVRIMRTMYHTCKLVHADLSEFNILYHAGSVHFIDVSQVRGSESSRNRSHSFQHITFISISDNFLL